MWIFNPEQTPQRKYAPDLMKDRDIVRISRQFPMWVVVSLAAPAVARRAGHLVLAGRGDRRSSGPRWCGSRLLHHVTWSINSICHTLGERPFVVPRQVRPTSGGWRSRPWASPGTTCTTPTPPAPGTACSAARSTPRPGSSGCWRSSAGCTTCAGRSRSASTPSSSESPGDKPIAA